MPNYLRDLRYAFRSLRAAPRFSSVAILTLAVGIGANTSIFSVMNGVLLKDLPYGNPQQLIRIRTVMEDGRNTGGGISPLEQHALREEFPSISHVTSTYGYDVTLLDENERPVRTTSYAVTEQFFETFGVGLHLGRGFLQEEFDPSAAPAVILGYGLWRDVYGGDPSVVGSTINTTEGSLPVVGVAPPDFDYPDGADAWFTLPHNPGQAGHFMQGVARMAPGVPLERVEGDLDILARRLQEETPTSNADRAFAVRPLVDEIVGDTRSTLILLMGATATLLLIACANVINLLLSRGAVRAKEIALRAALGASRGRLVAQLLTESLVLASLGAALGLGSSWVALRFLVRFSPSSIPRLDEVGVDLTVLLFTVGITALAGLLFGLTPALRLIRTDIRSLIGEGARGSSAGPARGRLLKVSVMAQMGLAAVLVTGAGLLVRSYAKLQETDPGFSPEGVLTVDVALPWNQTRYFRDVLTFYRNASDRLRDVPGVEAVGAVSTIPMGPQLDGWTGHYVVGRPVPGDGEGTRLRIRKTVPGYFEAMAIPLVEGRYLTDQDLFENPGVAVINQAAASSLFPGEDPIGQRIHRFAEAPGDSTGSPLGWNSRVELEIVGVVSDVRYQALNRPDDPSVYQPLAQHPWRRMTFALRTSEANPAVVTQAVRDAIWEVDPTLVLLFNTQEDLVSASLARETLGMLLLSMFALSALALASVGIYGVVSYTVTQRTAEMAIRASLGLTPTGVQGLLLKQGGLLALGGIGSGVVIALLARKVIASQLYEINAADPVVFLTVPLILLAVGLVAVFLPARRATRINLAATLRQE